MSDLADAAIKELPPAWRRAAYVAAVAIALTGAYFIFVAGPVADARDATRTNSNRIDSVQNDIKDIKSDVSDLKAASVGRDQKVDDIKESVDQMSQKLDRLLERQRP